MSFGVCMYIRTNAHSVVGHVFNQVIENVCKYLSILVVENGYQDEAVGHHTPFLSPVETHAAATSCRAHSDRGKEPCSAVSTIPAVEGQIPFLSDGDIRQSVLEGAHRPGVLH